MKKAIITLFIIAMIVTPTITHAGFWSNIFGKKETKIEQKNNNSIKSNVSNNATTNIGATTNSIAGDTNTVNIPDNQKSQLFNGNLFETFNPAFIRQNELNQAEIDTLKKLIEQQGVNNKVLVDKADIISTKALTQSGIQSDKSISQSKENTTTIEKPLNDISTTLKDPPPLKLHTDTQSILNTLNTNLVTPLTNIGTQLSELVTQLTTNNTALISAITNMPFPSAGGSGTSLVSANITQTAHGLVTFNWVYLTTAGLYTKAINTTSATSETIGMVTTVTDANTIKVTFDGYVTGLSGLTIGTRYYLSGTTAGAMTTTVPTTGIVRPIFIADSATSGYIQQYTSGESLPGTIAQVFASGIVTPSASQINAGTSVLIPGMTTTLTPNGTTKYLILTSVRARSTTTASNNSVDGGIQAALFDSTAPTVALTNSEVLPMYNANQNTISLNTVSQQIQATSGGSYILTLSSPMTLQVRAWNLAAATTGTVMADNNGRTSMTIIQLDNKQSVSGQSVDYVIATLPSSTTVANSVTPFVTQSGNITNTGGIFSLTASKTYKLQAFLSSNSISGSAIRFQWRNITSGLLIGNQGTTFAPTNGGAEGDSSYAETIFTPSVNTTVQLESTTSVAGTTGSLTIIELGSSAVYAGVYPGTTTNYTPVVTSTTGTNPTLPTSATISAYYSVEGKMMTLNFKYFAATTTNGVDGTQSYAYSMPAGYTIDLTKAAVPSVITNTSGSGLDGGTIGSGFGRNATASNSSGLGVVPLSSTTFGFYFEAATRLVGASALAATGASNTAIWATLRIPIN